MLLNKKSRAVVHIGGLMCFRFTEILNMKINELLLEINMSEVFF